MNPGMYYQLVEIENTHWWFVSRRFLIKSIFKKKNIPQFKNALDIGCGTGGNMNFLKSYCENISGLDCSEIAIKLAREKWPDLNFTMGDANMLSSKFPNEIFDFISLFNVMYHQWISDDKDLMSQIHSALRPGGYLLLTEPAFMHLWRRHDEQDLGKRRYKMSEMCRILKESGYEVVFKTYFNSISYLPSLILSIIYKFSDKNKSADSKKGASEVDLPGRFINNMMIAIMKAETYFISKTGSFPLGVSILCLARKI
jgi:SAM-dependent methyltransferase